MLSQSFYSHFMYCYSHFIAILYLAWILASTLIWLWSWYLKTRWSSRNKSLSSISVPIKWLWKYINRSSGSDLMACKSTLNMMHVKDLEVFECQSMNWFIRLAVSKCHNLKSTLCHKLYDVDLDVDIHVAMKVSDILILYCFYIVFII